MESPCKDLGFRNDSRMLADDLLRDAGALDQHPSAKADWIAHKIESSKFDTVGQLITFSRRLAAMKGERRSLAEFAARVAADSSQRSDVRVAVLDMFQTLGCCQI